MDLNYLFYRQQVERSRSDSAASEVARKAHEELAARYAQKIGEAAGSRGAEAWATESASPEDSTVNPTMAVALPRGASISAERDVTGRTPAKAGAQAD